PAFPACPPASCRPHSPAATMARRQNRGSFAVSKPLVYARGGKRIAGDGPLVRHWLPFGREGDDRLLFCLLVERRSDYFPVALAEFRQTRGAGCGDTLLDMARRKAPEYASFLLDQAELVPCLLAQSVRQRLHGTGAGGRICHEIEAAFVGEDELGIAGEPAREGVRQAMRDR